MIYFFIVLLAIALAGSLFNIKPKEKPQALLDIRTVAGADPVAVEKVLGKAEKLDPVKNRRSGCTACPKFAYKNGAIEIVYINGKADWLTLNLKGGKWDENAIEMLALPPATPTGKAPGAIRWEGNIPGFREIAVFPAEDQTIQYFYVKTVTD